MSEELQVQLLRSVRVFVHNKDPGTVILQVTGAVDCHYYALEAVELTRLARQLSHDAALLSVKPASPS